MNEYTLYVNFEISRELQKLRGKRGGEIEDFLRRLQKDPFEKGAFPFEKDGRTYEVKVFGPYLLMYWADHAVREVKVVELLRSDER